MTDKQIIDGIDVSGCNFTLERDGKIKCECCHATGFGVICDCESWKTCDYKNYKRKEQECERLKEQLNPKLKNAHCTYFEGQTGLCKAKEFTRCNPVNCKLYTIDELSTIVDLQEKLASKEQECEQLRGEIWVIEENLKDYIEHYNRQGEQIDQLKAKYKELKKANIHIENNRKQKADKLMRIEKLIIACSTGYTDEFIQELLVILHEPEPSSFENKYKTILAEIKEYCEKVKKDHYWGMRMIKFANDILQKISEVLNEKI